MEGLNNIFIPQIILVNALTLKHVFCLQHRGNFWVKLCYLPCCFCESPTHTINRLEISKKIKSVLIPVFLQHAKHLKIIVPWQSSFTDFSERLHVNHQQNIKLNYLKVSLLSWVACAGSPNPPLVLLTIWNEKQILYLHKVLIEI